MAAMLNVACPHCTFVMTDDGSLAGQLVSCPNCTGQLVMPSAVMGEPVYQQPAYDPGFDPGPAYADSGGGPKNSGAAAVMSFLVPGLGQIYNGDIGKGLMMIIGMVVSIVLFFFLIGFVTYFLIWLWSIYDAYNRAESINAKHRSRRMKSRGRAGY